MHLTLCNHPRTHDEALPAAHETHRAAPPVDLVDRARWSRFHTTLRNMLCLSLAAHLHFLSVFLLLGVRTLALYNLASLAVYAVAIVLGRHGRVRAAYVLGTGEVLVHATLATLVLGWGAGFHYYIPALAVLLFLYPRGSLAGHATWAGVLAVGYGLLAYLATGSTAPRPVDRTVLDLLNMGNAFLLTVVLATLTYLSTSAARRAEDGLRDAVTRLDDVARHDALTGLMNRRSMESELTREAARHDRTGRPFAVILADLDRFKRVNDRFGHHTGDRALVAVADVMRRALRVQDRVARWGGEEFLVLLPDTDGADALAAAERLRRAVGEMDFAAEGDPPAAGNPTDGGAATVPLTLTLGVALFAGGDWGQALREADRALYAAKNAGRNRVHAAYGA